MNDFDESARMAGPMAAYPNFEPKRIKVFGVLHIVFGGLGLLQVLGSVAMIPFQDKLMSLSNSGSPDELVEAQIALAENLQPYTWIELAITLVVAVLILRAGILLVKKRPAGLPASNLYAWVSMAAKVVTIVLFLLLALPAYTEMFDSVLGDSDPAAQAAMLGMRIGMVFGGIIVPVLAMIYPILSLVLLNKPVVKDYFGSQPR